MKLINIFESDQKERNTEYVRSVYAKGYQNPIGRGVYFYIKKNDEEDGLVSVILTPKVDYVYVDEITVGEDKLYQGYGGFIMKLLVEEADRLGVTLLLFPEPLAHAGKKKVLVSFLRKFYSKFGFEKDRKDSKAMIRYPK